MAGRIKWAFMHLSAKFCCDPSNCCRQMEIYRFFKNGDRPPYWICCTRDRSIHEEYMTVFAAVLQKLTGIDSVV